MPDLFGKQLDEAVRDTLLKFGAEVHSVGGCLPYSTSHTYGGPILERFRIGTAAQDDGSWSGYVFDHTKGRMVVDCEGPTQLIAGLLAFVKFGNGGW